MLSLLPDFKSLYDLHEYFKDEDACIKYLEMIRWDNKPCCPHCEHEKVYRLMGKTRRFKCASCRMQFSAKVGTIFEDTKIELLKWYIAIYLHSSHKKGISSIQLGKDIGVSQKTAWFMLQRIRYALDEEQEAMTGDVEVDESYVGGKNKNRHADKKVKNSQGRSYKDKTPVFGMVERGGNVVARVVANVKGNTVKPIIFEHAMEGATIHSDEYWVYDCLDRWYNRFVVFHGRKQYTNGDSHTNTIEGFWSHLKRGIIGIYHWVSRKHLQNYVNEFVFRYNTRQMNENYRFAYALSLGLNKRITYNQLVHGI